MTDAQLLETLATRQHGCLARWQLIAGGWTTSSCDHAFARLRRLHDGVYVTGYGPVTVEQLRWAAALTAPRTVLGQQSAGCALGVLGVEPSAPTVVRPGFRGIRRSPDLVVRYSATLVGNVVRRDGLWMTSAERTVIDLWPLLHGRERERVLRDAIRLKATTFPKLQSAFVRNAGRRGVGELRGVCDVYSRLPLSRCRSDAEIEGLVVLDRAGLPIPSVNVRRAGEEADFSWPGPRRIVEIDGPQFHRDPLEDARKTRVWTRAGWTVDRISSDDVYHRPERLLTLVADVCGGGQ